VTSNYGANLFPIKLSQRSASMLTLPRHKKMQNDDDGFFQSGLEA